MQLHSRIGEGELRHRHGDDVGPEPDRQADADLAALLGLQPRDRALGRLDFRDQPCAVLLQRAAGSGERQATRSALEQHGAHVALQLAQLAADRRGGYSQLARSLSQALRPRQLVEQHQCVQIDGVQAVVHRRSGSSLPEPDARVDAATHALPAPGLRHTTTTSASGSTAGYRQPC
jgi:hypothetical protein